MKLNVTRPLSLLSMCPEYRPTPLSLIEHDGHSCWVKDETDRMGLGSFKALGGIYAVAQMIIRSFDLENAPAADLLKAIRGMSGKMTFVCASAGNHGIAVATGAKIFGANARIFLSDSVPESFAARLRTSGAEVVRRGTNYEASVQAAIEDAARTGAILLADGSWKGYIEAPQLVMEGYTVIAEELRREFSESEGWPSHVFLQAGVGGMAAAIAHEIRTTWPQQPKVIVVEPETAACLKKSAERREVTTVDGPVSNMGRLDCKTPSLLAFEELAEHADQFVTVSDESAVTATATLAQFGFRTTPSGAAGFAAMSEYDIRDDTETLVIVTEGEF